MKISIGPQEADQRLDKFLRKYFKKHPEIKLGDIFAWIRKGVIKVNGKKQKPEYRLQLDDEIQINQDIKDLLKSPSQILITKDQKSHNLSLKDLKKQILFEDDNWIFWDKPAWVVIHPGNKHLNDLTLNDYLHAYLRLTTQRPKSKTFVPSFGFRLDKDTSGIIVAAKNYEALKYLNQLIRQRKTQKQYLALVGWKLSQPLTIQEPLFRGFNKKFWRAQMFVNQQKWVEAKTQIEPIKTLDHPILGPISLVKAILHTWRMHQIRVHLAHKWFPILGDILYGDNQLNQLLAKKLKLTRQLLHSHLYGFWDKFSKKNLQVTSPLPSEFEKVIS